ncbi:unnamed protein product [Angiostrongylus costaricensis]|uniref:Rho-GAP domain-containing protein n=1 Tax=Angiostrongylus costaricensis TaxID=334426 RepID=A0A0R3PEJ0_ANGCS|nr:unnamed protein product [Angiostrongylus costaricensis]
MVEELEKEKKRKGLRFVSRKSSRKTFGKWKKLNNMDNSDKINETHREEVIAIDVNPSLDGIPLPAFFRYSIDYVEAHGIMQEGIYRVSSPKSRLDELEKKANEGVQLDFCDGHEAAGLIKRFLRQLPSPLLSCDFEMLVRSCFCDWRGVCQCVVLTKVIILSSVPFMFGSKNKMGIHALGLLFQTVMDMSRQLVCYLISNGSSWLSKGQRKVCSYLQINNSYVILCFLIVRRYLRPDRNDFMFLSQFWLRRLNLIFQDFELGEIRRVHSFPF